MTIPTSSTSVDYALRPYQSDLVQQIWKAWATGQRRILLALPTGAGKTVLFSSVAHEFIAKQQPILVVVHREELLLQASEKLMAVTGLPVGIIKAGYKENRDCLIQVASVQTLRNRKFPKADLLILDEAHHSVTQSWTKLLEHYSDSYILGVTATPARNDGQGFKYLYDLLITGPTVRWLIENGYLSDFKLFAAPQKIKIKRPRKNNKGRDYTQEELENAVNTSLVMGDIIESWRQFALNKKTVIFAVSVKHSQGIAQAFNDAGIKAEHLDGETPSEERKAILERFKSGETIVLSNCGIVSEGFDVPTLEAVQIVRPTKSLILWLQMIGRSLRPSPGKEHAILIDHTENWACFGAPDQSWGWSLEPVSLEEQRWNISCPKCHHIFKPLPHEQKPVKYEWVPKHKEYRAIVLITCPNCQETLEMEKWLGDGEPPFPRIVGNDPLVEIREIPTDCDWQVLGYLYDLVNRHKTKKKLPRFEILAQNLVDEFGERVLVPELRECALFYLKDEAVANIMAQSFYQVVQEQRDKLAKQENRQSQLNQAIADFSEAQTPEDLEECFAIWESVFFPSEIFNALSTEQQQHIYYLQNLGRLQKLASVIAEASDWKEVISILAKNAVKFDTLLPYFSDTQKEKLLEYRAAWQEQLNLFNKGNLPKFATTSEALKYWKSIQLDKEYKPYWIYHQLLKYKQSPSLEDLKECAVLMGYSIRWAYHKWEELQPPEPDYVEPIQEKSSFQLEVEVVDVPDGQGLDSDDNYGWDALDDETYSYELERAECDLIWEKRQQEEWGTEYDFGED
ncbi:DEAD/DEAH box helicase [Ancylothrix sp. C2]|uniref:DEAD/DEAH box helicase n=1 Tax=Ancylothrix sp. D3o TaxID=2953691 RepID=UPI0021BAD894|nr:DEAD/DEAH box helicase [Ancylothrix sp. D3o]MCT7953025.1 DEAD/DEAH box helicase [Ancylothrix sp. D3o]